jgi:hypothetical protein
MIAGGAVITLARGAKIVYGIDRTILSRNGFQRSRQCDSVEAVARRNGENDPDADYPRP